MIARATYSQGFGHFDKLPRCAKRVNKQGLFLVRQPVRVAALLFSQKLDSFFRIALRSLQLIDLFSKLSGPG